MPAMVLRTNATKTPGQPLHQRLRRFPDRRSAIGCFLALIGLLATSPAAIDRATAEFGVTDPSQFSVPEGFKIELVYEVPSKQQGSWVSLAVDPEGRLVTSDQSGGLYRITIDSEGKASVEPLKTEVGSAQGLLYAFDSLYVTVNGRKGKNGVYRLRDTDGDDQFDQTEYILPLDGGGEHGPHALILSKDKKRIIMCGGNMTKLPGDIARSRVPQVWEEDHLLGRMPDARGHAADRMAPGGWIGSFNPEGKDFELIASGFRNEYDIAMNKQGEVFTYDADMEWDVGTPWYRPTRVNHVISGAEFGWRNGTGKWPAYLPDSFGAAVNIGPGSPTGICFGYGTNFPAPFQDALFIADWSYGNIHAVHLTAEGSSYGGTYETFTTAAPLPVTDLAVRPQDGCLYFAIGGRNTQSALYRIVYTGDAAAKSEPQSLDGETKRLIAIRKELESFHIGGPNEDAVALAINYLSSEDRGVRFAARVALEHQPVASWKNRIAKIEDPGAKVLAVIALARVGSPDDQAYAINQLQSCDWDSLSDDGRIALLRAYALTAIRLGELTPEQSQAALSQIAGQFPTGNDNLDRELAQMLVYLKVPEATEQIVAEMTAAPSQENQIFYALTLRGADKGWNDDLYRKYFAWFQNLQAARGGASFGGFINNIRDAALENVPEQTKQKLADVLAATEKKVVESESRPFVKKWQVDELLEQVSDNKRVPNFENGKSVFAAAQCYKCHRMGIQGGILGPDLTGAGGRFSPKDLLVAMIHPDRTISDQYGATQFLTDEGKAITGRVVNLSGNTLRVMTNMLDPASLTNINRDEIEVTRPSKTSMMPAGLLDTLTAEEIADLIAYLRAGGKQTHPIYRRTVAGN